MKGRSRNRQHRPIAELAALALLLSVALPADAHAYIDPGSGALFLQAILAGIAGSLFMARERLGRALRWVLGRRRVSPQVAPPAGLPGEASPGGAEARPAPPPAPND